MVEEEFGSEVGAVGPRDRVEVDLKVPEVGGIAEGLEDWPRKRTSKVDFALGAVVEAEPEREIGDVSSVNNIDHELLQWRNWVKRFALGGELPIVKEIVLVELEPLEYEAECTTGKLPLDDAVFDAHSDAELAVLGVEVGRRMLVVVHGDHDAEEAAQFRH